MHTRAPIRQIYTNVLPPIKTDVAESHLVQPSRAQRIRIPRQGISPERKDDPSSCGHGRYTGDHIKMFRRQKLDWDSDGQIPKSHVLPHTPEAGDPYYIGDIYHRLHPHLPSSQSPWSGEKLFRGNTAPYLGHIEKLSEQWPYMRYLVDFMYTTCAPPKQKFLTSTDKLERASRIKGCLLKISSQHHEVERRPFATLSELHLALDEYDEQASSEAKFLFVIEDLSRDVIECLGSRLQVDPRFFRGHISDYLWYNTRDPWVELPELELFAQRRNFFHVRYFHPRYFRNRASLTKARIEAGHFNVLRRIDVQNDRNLRLDEPDSIVGLVRCKTSLWTQPKQSSTSGNVGILLLDPPITEGHPLWGGYSYFTEDQSVFLAGGDLQPHCVSSIYESFIYWTQQLSEPEKAAVDDDPRFLTLPVLIMAVAGWSTALEYANTRLTQIEWELENPSFHLLPRYDALDGCLRRLHRWRRVFPVYSSMISEVLSRVLKQDDTTKTQRRLSDLAPDFERLLSQISELQRRAESIAHLVGTMISVEENKRASEQNVNLTRLTYLAFVFIPFSYVASFFSMTSDLSELSTTIWVYFVVATPLTIICLFGAFFLGYDRSMFASKTRRSQEPVRSM